MMIRSFFNGFNRRDDGNSEIRRMIRKDGDWFEQRMNFHSSTFEFDIALRDQ